MHWTLADVLSVLGMLVFAGAVCATAEFFYRRNKCVCAHRRNEHHRRSGRCQHDLHISRLSFQCVCDRFRSSQAIEELIR